LILYSFLAHSNMQYTFWLIQMCETYFDSFKWEYRTHIKTKIAYHACRGKGRQKFLGATKRVFSHSLLFSFSDTREYRIIDFWLILSQSKMQCTLCVCVKCTCVCMCVCRCVHVCVYVCACVCIHVSVYICNTRFGAFKCVKQTFDSFKCAVLVFRCSMTRSDMRRDSFRCATWLIQIRDMTHSDVRRGSFRCATWIIQICDVRFYVRHHTFRWATWLIQMCDMTHSNVQHDSLGCTTWLVKTCIMTRPHVYGWVMRGQHVGGKTMCVCTRDTACAPKKIVCVCMKDREGVFVCEWRCGWLNPEHEREKAV